MLFVGDDWAEAHHDIEIVDETGRVLARRRLPEGVTGLAALHALVADHLGEDDEPDQVLVGIETDRGPWVQALIAAGYTVYRGQPAAGGPLPGTARRRPGRSPTPATRTCWPRSCGWTGPTTGRLAGDSDAGRAGQGAGPRAPVDDLDPAAAGQHAALDAARVLPGRAGRVRRRPGRPRRARGAGGRARPRSRAAGSPRPGSRRVLRRAGRQRNLDAAAERDPGRAAHRAAAGPARAGRRLRAPACPRWSR